jgi:hypothetical protein
LVLYTLAGNPESNDQRDGKGDKAGFENLSQLIAKDGYLYALDQYEIRKIKFNDSPVTTFAGNILGGDSRNGLKVPLRVAAPLVQLRRIGIFQVYLSLPRERFM